MTFKRLAETRAAKFYRIVVTWLVLIGCTTMFSTQVLAADKQPCDCMDVKLEPSKERIKITRAKEVNNLLQAVEKNNPTKAELLKRQVATASTFLQRHMNGDIYQDQAPDDWDAYNGPIMAMSMTEWMRRKYEHDNSGWVACPRAELVAILVDSNSTVVRFELVAVGRFVKVGKTFYDAVFTDAVKGSAFTMEITVNEQAKVSGMRQIPQGYSSSPYTTALHGLSQRIKTRPAVDFGESQERLSADNAKYLSEIAAIKLAAKVCTATTNTGK